MKVRPYLKMNVVKAPLFNVGNGGGKLYLKVNLVTAPLFNVGDEGLRRESEVAENMPRPVPFISAGTFTPLKS